MISAYSYTSKLLSRQTLNIVATVLLIIAAFNADTWSQEARLDDSKANFYVGTYTRHLPEEQAAKAGISLWSVDVYTGDLTMESGPWSAANPSYVVLGVGNQHLYSVNEMGTYKGTKSGYLTTYDISRESSSLVEQKTITSNGSGPAYLSIDRSGKFLLLANYGAGNIAVYPIGADGSPGDATANVPHSGSGVNDRRQEAPHPHSIVASPDNRYVFVPDLGLDKIKAYAFDVRKGTLEAKPELDVVTPPGSGPRHLTFDPSGKFAYCSLEMGNQVAAYRYSDGVLNLVGYYGTLPDDFDGDSTTAEVRVSPNGKNVYVSNRGHDSIAVFTLDFATGVLKLIQTISTEGKVPRNFALDPSGRVMVVGNQRSDSLLCYRVDAESGKLSRIGEHATIPAPSYICFY